MAVVDDKQIKEILKYNPMRQYIGKMSASALHSAYGNIPKSQNWNNPQNYSYVTVGKINGDVICRALWNEMSYNPVRFGTVSPFEFDGRNNIYRFCNVHDMTNIPESAWPVIQEVRYHLIEYLKLNSAPNGAWRDELDTNNGMVIIGISDAGYANDTYKKLSHLRAGIKVIARQNMDDVKKKRSPWRAGIIEVINKRHPDGRRPLVPSKSTMASIIEISDTIIDDDRIDNAIESACITMDNAAYVSKDIYEQACKDYETFMLYDSEYSR